MKNFSVNQIIRAYDKKGYKMSQNDSRQYNLNILGVRSNDPAPNLFNDMIFWLYKYCGGWAMKQAPCTTDPGLYYLENPCNVNGTAILKPGQYPGVWEIGLHNGQYEALVQKGVFTIIRDFNRDGKLDYNSGRQESGSNFKINCHHAGTDSARVDKWSAGCQVFKRLADFEAFMADCRKARDIWGNSFTYTLLEEDGFE